MGTRTGIQYDEGTFGARPRFPSPYYYYCYFLTGTFYQDLCI